MTEPNYLDNHLYVLRGDLKQFRRHVFQMVDDLAFVTRHGALRNLGAIRQSVRAQAYLWKHPGPSRERIRRIAFIAVLSAGVVAALTLVRPASAGRSPSRK